MYIDIEIEMINIKNGDDDLDVPVIIYADSIILLPENEM